MDTYRAEALSKVAKYAGIGWVMKWLGGLGFLFGFWTAMVHNSSLGSELAVMSVLLGIWGTLLQFLPMLVTTLLEIGELVAAKADD
jgi:hypothetical protein